MSKERIITDDAPRTDNPYAQGVRAGDTLYVSGYGPVDPDSGAEVEGDAKHRPNGSSTTSPPSSGRRAARVWPTS
jgi:enamine deaminase RidA (YjgF/YER057c/UK114 family)